MNPVMADNSAAGMTCPRCTAAVIADDQFCPECGHGLASLSPANRADMSASLLADICRRCSTPKQPGDDFCSHCGQSHASDMAPKMVSPKMVSPQVMPIAIPAARPTHLSKPVPPVLAASVRPVLSATKAAGPPKSKPFALVLRGVFLFIAFIFMLHFINNRPRSNAMQNYNASQSSATTPTGAPSPAAAPATPGPMSAEDQQAYYQYSARGLSLGNYLWCRQTLLASGASPSSVPGHLLWLKQVSDGSSEQLSVVASAGCHIALANGDMGRATQQIRVLSYYASQYPGGGIFNVADSAAQGRPDPAQVAIIRSCLESQAGGSPGNTVAYQETMDAIEAAGAARAGSHP